MPMTPLRGVRSSWLMLATNTLLAALAAIAASLARPSSRWVSSRVRSTRCRSVTSRAMTRPPTTVPAWSCIGDRTASARTVVPSLRTIVHSSGGCARPTRPAATPSASRCWFSSATRREAGIPTSSWARIAGEPLGRRAREGDGGEPVEHEDGVVRALDDGAVALLADPEGLLGPDAGPRHRDHLADQADDRDLFGLGVGDVGSLDALDPALDDPRLHAEERGQRIDREAGRSVEVALEEASRDPADHLVALGSSPERGLGRLALRDVLDDGLHDAAAVPQLEDGDAYVGDERSAVEPPGEPLAALGPVGDRARDVQAKRVLRGRPVRLTLCGEVEDARPLKLLDARRSVQRQRGGVAVDEGLGVERSECDRRRRPVEERAIETLGVREGPYRAIAGFEASLEVREGRFQVLLTHARRE